MLSQSQKQFIYKRSLFQKIAAYLSWSIGISAAITWGLIFWLKPQMVDPQAVLALLQEKNESGVDLTQMADISILAVTGVTAISALFFMIIILAMFMLVWNKKEKQYLEIIRCLEKSDC